MLVIVTANKEDLMRVTPKNNIVPVLINLALLSSLCTRRFYVLRKLLLVKAIIILLKLFVKIRVSSKR